MARHSHWAQIKLKKGALDKKRGKIFSKHARLIEVAARAAGGEPNMNPGLRIAIENARSDNMPRENIERAIKKAIGEANGGVQLEEVSYEGYGPGGIAVIVDTLTDNKNRTLQTVRKIFQKHGGALGSAGATSFLFETKGVINVKQKTNADQDSLDTIDAGAEDIQETSEGLTIYTSPDDLMKVKDKLKEKGFFVQSAGLNKLAKNLIEITDATIAKKIFNLIDTLEEEDDVSGVAANFDIASGLLP